MTSNLNDLSLKCHVMKAKQQTCTDKFLQYVKHRKSHLDVIEKKLMRAVTLNNCEKVEEMLTSNISPNISDNLFRTPLHLAASRNYKDMVKLLLKYGADPNQRDIIGNTALHLAACSNNLEIVTLLLDAGTNVSSLDKHGRNPLQLAESKLKLLQNSHREGFIELTQLRTQLQQIIDLMQSFLRRQRSNTNSELEMLNFENLKLNDSNSQIDDQMSNLLAAIQNIALK